MTNEFFFPENMKPARFFVLVFSSIISLGAFALKTDAGPWLNSESQVAVSKIIQNISMSDTFPGAVIASPSRQRPDYYYHWIRDAALTMDVVVTLRERAKSPDVVKFLEKKIRDYINFSVQNQTADSITGLGEPKFYVDGCAYGLPWGRPQNDGPALRAIALMHYSKLLIQNGRLSEVAQLYDSKIPTGSPIKRDLEYVSNHWQDSSFDLWEEVLGDHFYTRMVQRKALLEGADLARRLGDQGASDWYLRQAQKIKYSLESFWDKRLGYIQTTLNWKAGVDYKKSNLDVASLLAVLHGNCRDGYFDYSDERVARTVNELINNFRARYDINHVASFPGVAIGRYPEDRYDGENFQGGNPWVLATLAIAETYYELAAISARNPQLNHATAQLFAIGDVFVQRVQTHANPDGSLSEQIERRSGYMTSAIDLTWNYAAVLTTQWARERAQSSISNSAAMIGRLHPHSRR